MKVISLNAWGGKLHGELLPYLAASAPDVLCLQEVVHSPLSHKDWLTYRDGDHVLDQRANLFRDVCLALPGHVATFCPAAQGVLWDGDAAVPSQWGLATFVRRSLPVVAQAQGSCTAPILRRATAITRARAAAMACGSTTAPPDVPSASPTCTACATSTARGTRPSAWRRRTASSTCRRGSPDRAIWSWSAATSTSSPGSETLRLLAAAGLTELVTDGGFPGTRTSHYGKPGRFADYMLVNRPADVTGFDVVYRPEVSDHCPLVLEI